MSSDAKQAVMMRIISLKNVVGFLEHGEGELYLLEEELARLQTWLVDRALLHTETEGRGNGEKGSNGDSGLHEQGQERRVAEVQAG